MFLRDTALEPISKMRFFVQARPESFEKRSFVQGCTYAARGPEVRSDDTTGRSCASMHYAAFEHPVHHKSGFEKGGNDARAKKILFESGSGYIPFSAFCGCLSVSSREARFPSHFCSFFNSFCCCLSVRMFNTSATAA